MNLIPNQRRSSTTEATRRKAGHMHMGRLVARTGLATVLLACLNSQAIANLVPTVNVQSLTINERSASERYDVQLTLSEAAAETCTVSVTLVEGTAETAVDFRKDSDQPDSVSFAAGELVKNFSLYVGGDGQPEPDETFDVVLSGATGCQAGDNGRITIIDDDSETFGPILNIASIEINESQLTGRVRMTVSEPVTETCGFTLLAIPGSASLADYRGEGLGVFLKPGNVSQEYVFQVVNDDIVEADESFTLVPVGLGACATRGSDGTVTIIDDDGPASDPSVTIGSITVREGETSTATVDVRISQAPTADVFVEVGSSADTAFPGSDYVDTTQTLQFSATSPLTQTVSFPILNDTVVESTETFTVDVVGGNGAIVNNSGQVVILDDDDAALTSVMYFDGYTIDVYESTPVARVLLHLDQPSPTECTGSVATVERAAFPNDAAEENLDFTPLSLDITFAAGETTKFIDVPIIQNADLERLETFAVVLDTVTGGCRRGSRRATVRIFDEDGEPDALPVVILSNATALEGSDSEISLTLMLPRPAATDVVFPVRSRQRTAISGEDFTGRSEDVTVGAGEISTTITYPILDSAEIEPVEFFTVSIPNEDGPGRLLRASGIVTIKDDDNQNTDGNPRPVVSVGSSTVTEGDAPDDVTVPVTLSQESDQTVIVEVAPAPGTATAGDDYITATQIVTFAPSERSKLVSWTIVDDDQAESTETFSLRILSADNADIGSNGQVTILDDDGSDGETRLDIGDANVTEGVDAQAEVALALSQVSTTPVVVEIASRQREAISGPDYLGRNYIVTFAPGETLKTVAWAIVDDIDAEPAETFAVVVVNITGAAEGSFGTVTINDNDDGGSRPVLNIGDASVTEGTDAVADVELMLSQASTAPVTVEVASRQREAISGPDYLGRNYDVTFAPGETRKTVSWGIIDDTEIEPAETFAVVPVSVNGADEGRLGTVTINDNDGGDGGGPRLDIGDAAVTEGSDTMADVVLTLSQAATGTVTVEVASRQRTFEAGETQKTVSWGIVDDTEAESAETFAVVPVSITGAIEGRSGTVVINDNDGGGGDPSVDIGDAAVTEGSDEQATVALTLSRASTAVVTVEVASRQREAISGRPPRHLPSSRSISWVLLKVALVP